MLSPIFLIVILGQILFPPPNQMRDFKPIVRPLSEFEEWHFTLAVSDAVGIGRIRKIQLDSPEVPPDAGIGVIFRETYRLSFEPIVWLKNDLGTQTIDVYCSSDRLHTRKYGPPLDQSPNDLVLLFAKQWEKDWYLFETKDGFEGGAMIIEEEEIEEIQDEVVHSLRMLSLDSLVAYSDLIIVGTPHVGDVSPCQVAGRESNCTVLKVEKILKGKTMKYGIPAYNMYGTMGYGRGVYFLRDVGGGTYETFPIFGGAMPIEDGRVTALDLDESTAISRIEKIAHILRVGPNPWEAWIEDS